jgi:serine/threonine-protein kinase
LSKALSDRYKIERELGSGGMATVYLAEDLKLERKVAVKVLRPELAVALGPERFLREVKLTARLQHPHILPLHDSGEAEEFLYYVMPYVEGESLRDRLNREKQLPVEDALQIAREVADALGSAHKHNVIHRDIKPENILLEEGHAVVADFGIARAVDVAGGTKLTETGIALGTPEYMSPEQGAGSGELDGRSDIYSLGCVLYEMLGGQPPFTGVTVESVIHQHIGAKPSPVSEVREAVPSQVTVTLDRMLAKTPADRFATAAQFSEALAARVPTRAAPAAPASVLPRSRRVGRLAIVGVAGVVAVAGALLVFALGREPPVPAEAAYERTAIAVLPFQNLTTAESRAYFASGLHDELLTQLAKVAALKVISRTSVLSYASTAKPLTEIAAELAVGSIVEGSVQVEGNRLRVNVQLIDAATDEHVWAERYDRTLDDAFATQSEIAERIVTAVGATLTDAEGTAIATAPTDDAEAYRLYLQGEEYRRRPGYLQRNLEIAQQLYERALERDPEFALAYASLSYVHGTVHWFGYDPYPSRLESQRAAAEAAVRLAPGLPQARWAMGLVHYQGPRDYAKALEEFTLAVEGLPGSAELWSYVGYAHRRLGHLDQALAAYEKVIALDPRDAQVLDDLGGNTLRQLRRYEEAIAVLNRALELAPDLGRAQLMKAHVYLRWRGELDTLRNLLERGPESYGPSGSKDVWRVRLALWERKPEVLLTLLGVPVLVTFESGLGYTPGLLYAAWAQQLRGDRAAAAQAFTGALQQLDSVLRELPDDWRVHASRGLALAGLGRPSEAKREADWVTKSTAYADLWERPVLSERRARIFAQAGLVAEALAEIEPLLAGPSWTSVHMLRLDPIWDPIRDDPRFQALLEKYDKR